MESDQPTQAAMEAATADLLHLGFLEIRFLTAPLLDAHSADALDRRRERANMIADLCHQLPGLLAPQRRDQLADGLRYLWRTATATKRQWLRSRWDHLNYDHRWLTEAATERPTSKGKLQTPTRRAHQLNPAPNDLGRHRATHGR